MKLDGNFHGRETTELKPEISQRRKNIETYIITRYGMNPVFAQQVSSILDKTKLNDRDIRSGMYDSVIELTVQQMTQQKVSSLNDAKHISEAKETLYSQGPSNTQSQIPQQQSVQLTEEQKRKYEEQRQKLSEQMQQAENMRSEIMSRRGRR